MRATLLLLALFFAGTPLFAQGRGGGGRNPWDRMSRMDTDGDGKISREEFTGPDRAWDRLDADGDGFVTEQEAKNMRRGGRGGMRAGRGQGGMGGLTQRFDADGDGKVSAEEWQAFFKTADTDGDGFLTSEEFMGAMRGGGERGRGRPDNAPREGTLAPKATARRLVGGKTVDLARPKRTTVLVFGSYT